MDECYCNLHEHFRRNNWDLYTSVLILNETISLQQGLGITVIFIGLALFLLQPNSNKKA